MPTRRYRLATANVGVVALAGAARSISTQRRDSNPNHDVTNHLNRSLGNYRAH